MIPNAQLRVVESSPIAASAEFGISISNSAHIMTILRNTLYSDKVLAVLREYGANAWDSHRESGKDTVPIKVTLPTQMDPALSIRDFGAGLSQEQVLHVFTQYGESTKRTSDRSVGMLGIGSKSGFAYSDSFTITSHHEGAKKTYVAVLDQTEKGQVNLLHEEPCPMEDTGLLIHMPVRHEDISEFEKKAQELYQYFLPPPEINTTLPKMPQAQASLKHGVIYEDSYDRRSRWVAIMGCIPYRIDLDQLQGMDKTPEGGVAEFLSDLSGALYFNIGEVQISASRESLEYRAPTKVKLVEKFNLLVEEYVRHTLDTINTGGFTPWERRVRAQVLNRLRLPVPTDCKDMTSKTVPLKDKTPDTIAITKGNKQPATSITIEKECRFVICDDRRALLGFRLTGDDYQVRPVGKRAWADVRKDVDLLCEQTGLMGMPILKLSEMVWHPPTRAWNGKTINVKHKQTTFRFKPGVNGNPRSKNWEFEERVPTKDDVFVIIEAFVVRDFGFSEYYREDAKLFKIFGGTMPEIYAYKSTEKHPVIDEECIGTPYLKWRKELAKRMLTPDVKVMLDQWHWAQKHTNHGYGRNSDKHVVESLSKNLGDTHPITILFKRTLDGKEFFKKKTEFPDGLRSLEIRAKDLIGPSDAEAEFEALYVKYPLLTIAEDHVAALWGEHADKWLHYVNLVDKP